MKHGRHIWLLMALLVVAAAGCRLADRFRLDRVPTPRTKVTAVKVTERTDEGARIEITVELTNPGDVALALVSAGYTVRVGGAAPVTFSSQPNRTLPAGGSQTVTLPAVLALSGGTSGGGEPARTLPGVVVTGSIVYEPPGEIRQLLTESKVPLPSAQFRYRGQLE